MDCKELRALYKNANHIALSDPDIDWPSPNFGNALDAILDALDKKRYELEEVKKNG